MTTNKRTFERTHPWICFKIDLRDLPWATWVKLGECQSKCAHVAKTLLRPDVGREMRKLHLTKGALATVAIEGNTLTEKQVLQHLDGSLQLPQSTQYLQREVGNVLKACNAILHELRSDQTPPLSFEHICAFNRQILDGLTLPDHVVAGEVRTSEISVGRYQGAPAEDCRYLLKRFCEWMEREGATFPDDMSTVGAIVRAILAHLYLAWIHPFGDGNGRTARMVEHQILLFSGVPTPAAHLLSNYYNQTRTEYYRQLQAASATGGDVMPFLDYAVQGLLDGLDDQLRWISGQQTGDVWRNYVYDCFDDNKSIPARRQRDLVLDLSQQPDPVPLAEAPELSRRLVRAYAKCGERTFTRDINKLKEMDLVEVKDKTIRAKIEILQAFLPERAREETP